MKTIKCLITIYIYISSFFIFSQIDENIIQKIKKEGIKNSQVMDILESLTNVYSPRLSGSKFYLDGAKWVEKTMTQWGCNVTLEPYELPVKGWEISSFSVEMVSPRYERIIAQPVAWSEPINEQITGVPLIVDIFNINELKKLKGKLKGRILMHSKIKPRRQRQSEVLTKKELDSVIKYTPKPNDFEPYRDYVLNILNTKKGNKKLETLVIFLKNEGVSSVISPSLWDNHTLEVSHISFHNTQSSIPWFIISKETHAKLRSMIKKGAEPKLTLSLKIKSYNKPEYNVNILADIKGNGKRKPEIVIAGAHFDTWHGSGNASDNNAGVAIIMEAFRILKKLNIEPKRTIRAGFWGGEEQEFYGSISYLKKHLGDINRSNYKKEHKKLSAYFNIDSGGGIIRSFFTQANQSAQKIATPWVNDFKNWGLEHISSMPSHGSDHLIFASAGIPCFDAYQNPSFYWSLQHHTNIDEVALIDEEKMKKNAVIMATFIYKAAMIKSMIPRK